MSYEIIVHSRAAKSIKELPKSHRAKLSEFLDTLKNNPVPFRKFDIKKLKGYQDRYRARFGDFRLTYQIDKKEKVILVLKLERRGRAYK
ncbi:type II toxin-antitoxin system RelE family toxin [Geoglobus acetivorans]|uniref:RelE/StbE replicon stabilization toxin n=1 Tax=Geoglobus acetivorans TaxID=565033 RepID=A0A0A7GC16_GEOAI|nr:RelE/StbE replicon stabilization toxin [Geoglobus acetivorans]